MAETRAEQVAFGWAGEGTPETSERTGTEVRASTPRPLRGRYARGERVEGRRGQRSASARGSTGSPRAGGEARPDALPPDNEL